ncbi:MAG TPA: pyridoxal-dependent decarboxylase [Pilimelia sp.]|nr:pyridoxal-dependent decarboxylase [Pilimelia sp.]
MTPAEFRRLGRAAVDWVADYWERLESLPVAPAAAPGAVGDRLPAAPPPEGERFEDLLADLDDLVVPGLLHWQHPRFFGYFPANTSGPAVLADLLSAGLGVQGMSWFTGPACTEVEQRVLDWLADLLDLPARFRSAGPGGGVIQDTASSALLVAVVAALHRASGGTARRDGVGERRYGLYVTAETHSSATKAAVVAGLGERAVRHVPTDPATHAMDPAALGRRLARDAAGGVRPLLVVATVGTTGTTAVDPVAAIGALARRYGLWLHVDAAYAGVAAVCPELRWLHDGVAEYADSYCTNPHKWLLTTFDCDTFWVGDRTWLTGALQILPEYLRNTATDTGAATDFRDWQVPLGRRFRALKLWAVLRWYGVEGLRRHIRRGVAMAAQFAGWVAADPRFAVVAPHPLGLVCFRLRGPAGGDPDAVNAALRDRVNGSGTAFLTHTRVGGRLTLRLAVGGVHTEEVHVRQAWDCIAAHAADVLSAAAGRDPASAPPPHRGGLSAPGAAGTARRRAAAIATGPPPAATRTIGRVRRPRGTGIPHDT